MVGWHQRLNGPEFGQTPGDGEGQGSLVCCRAWGREELDTTECLNSNNSSERICSMSVNVSESKEIIFSPKLASFSSSM